MGQLSSSQIRKLVSSVPFNSPGMKLNHLVLVRHEVFAENPEAIARGFDYAERIPTSREPNPVDTPFGWVPKEVALPALIIHHHTFPASHSGTVSCFSRSIRGS